MRCSCSGRWKQDLRKKERREREIYRRELVGGVRAYVTIAGSSPTATATGRQASVDDIYIRHPRSPLVGCPSEHGAASHDRASSGKLT